ncbi:ABC transporter substrate-binding protein [Salipiger profundus]|uniref:ABC transporter substrate-binding protein n=1 Tax=Salipiger profundus TaxID=1229727 RepID=UPI0008E1626E|nr:ABC transporter substrate-binding protein [Salipiger profundus]SFD77435.1 iron complex transport system substrate-binding protein [Salipiger profundus]
MKILDVNFFWRQSLGLCALLGAMALPAAARDITDALGRTVEVPDKVERIICSGPGCLRFLTYLGAQDMAVAVDAIEKRPPGAAPRAYAIAHPELRDLPLFGEHRGRDNPELILALDPAPQVILKTLSSIGVGHDDLSNQTGLPVVAIDPGDLAGQREALDAALRIMGATVGRDARAEEVIAFFDSEIEELAARAARSGAEAPGVYVGGVAFQGAQGFTGTEPFYPPFDLLGLKNLARTGAPGNSRHSVVAREQIVDWDPEILFLDLGTVRGEDVGGLHELRTDAAYRGLTAVAEGEVWGVLPNTLYHVELGSVLANAWFIGSVTRPDAFGDVDPVAKAKEIESFLVGKPVFDTFNAAYGKMVFQHVPVE